MLFLLHNIVVNRWEWPLLEFGLSHIDEFRLVLVIVVDLKPSRWGQLLYEYMSLSDLVLSQISFTSPLSPKTFFAESFFMEFTVCGIRFEVHSLYHFLYPTPLLTKAGLTISTCFFLFFFLLFAYSFLQ